jgi:hypothetical protein
MDVQIWSTSLLRGPLLYAEKFLKSGTPEVWLYSILRRDFCDHWEEFYWCTEEIFDSAQIKWHNNIDFGYAS